MPFLNRDRFAIVLAALLSAVVPAMAGVPVVGQTDRITAAVAELKAAALSCDDDAQHEAAYRLQREGEAAIPALIQALRDKNSDVRDVVSWALECLSPLPGSAIDTLISGMNDQDVNYARAAAATLAKIKAVPALRKALRSGNGQTRMRAVYALGECGREADKAVPQLIALLNDKDPKVRDNAIWALGKIAPPGKKGMNALIGLFGQDDYTVCGRAADSLAGYGADRATPEVMKLLSSRDKFVRSCAARYFIFTEPRSTDVIRALRAALQDPEPLVRLGAAGSLARLAPKTKGIARELAKMLLRPEAKARMEAAGALSWLGTAAKDAEPDLKKALADEDPEVRAYAAAALAVLAVTDPPANELLKVLIPALKDEDRRTRVFASWALIRLSTAAAGSVPELSSALEDEETEVRDNAMRVLGKIGPAARPAVPAMVRSRRHYGEIDLSEFQEMIARIGPAGKEALPELIAALRSKPTRVGLSALGALNVMGADAVSAVPVIVERLDSGDEFLRLATELLQKLGPAAVEPLVSAMNQGEYPYSITAASVLARLGEPGLPALRSALESKDEFVVMCAARALGGEGPAAASALPELSALLDSGSPFVSARASEAIKEIKK